MKKRGNGQGYAYKRGQTWTAAKVFGYRTDEGGKRHAICATKGGFRTKSAALAYIPELVPPGRKTRQKPYTVAELYALWLPDYERRGRTASTMNCYKAAYNHMEAVWGLPFPELTIEDWQDLVDDCRCGKRTKQNMRVLIGLLYKYAIPRGLVFNSANLAEYIFISGESGRRTALTRSQVDTVRKAVGVVPYADYIYCHCYLGYRPAELLSRTIEEHYDRENRCIYGGHKTKAGMTRTVTISPKIQPIIDSIIGERTSGYIFCAPDGRQLSTEKYRELFYTALAQMHIQAPGDHTLTPYSCRHTFASMVDGVAGHDNAKLELMGHTSDEMLHHYQHADLDGLRSVTDAI